MSIVQERNELKGQKKGSRKDPPQIPSVGDHMPPASIFLSNTGNCAHRNNLSSVAWSLQRENAAQILGSPPTAASTPMLERVQKRVLNTFMDAKTTLQTKWLQSKSTNSLPITMPPSNPLLIDYRTYSARRRLLIPALIYNTPWISTKSCYKTIT